MKARTAPAASVTVASATEIDGGPATVAEVEWLSFRPSSVQIDLSSVQLTAAGSVMLICLRAEGLDGDRPALVLVGGLRVLALGLNDVRLDERERAVAQALVGNLGVLAEVELEGELAAVVLGRHVLEAGRQRGHVTILDRPRGRAGTEVGARGVRERDRERLVALVLDVVLDLDRDALGGGAGAEAQRSARRGVVVARGGAAVRGRVVDGDRSRGRLIERDVERDRAVVALLAAPAVDADVGNHHQPVLDRPRGRTGTEVGPGGIREGDGEALVALVLDVVGDRDRDRLAGFPSGEAQRAARCGVVVAGVGAAVRGRVVDADGPGGRLVERDGEVDVVVVALGAAAAGDADGRRGLNDDRSVPDRAGGRLRSQVGARGVRQGDGERLVALVLGVVLDRDRYGSCWSRRR